MPARILVIEDNPANLELMSYLLKAFGHSVCSAADGEEGLAAARRERPELIVCDLQLPRMDGYEVARQLKRDPAMRAIPIVAVTAFAMVGDRDKVMAAGFDGYIAKPINPETFIQDVEAYMRSTERGAAPAPAAVAPKARSRKKLARRATILVVDNASVNIDLLRGTLEPFGYEVIAANSVAGALELARQAPPGMIVSDIHMPGESGYDLIRAIKADPALCAIPFVFLTSTMRRESDLASGLALGADDFIFRPIEPQALLAKVEAILLPQDRTNGDDPGR